MPTISELQETLQNLMNTKISQTDIAEALGTGRSNISLRIKNNSQLSFDEVKKIEDYFLVKYNKQTLNLVQTNNVLNQDKFINIPYWELLPEHLKSLEVDYIPVQRKVIERGWNLNPDTLRIVPMVGDKMSKYWYQIREDDLLIIDTAQNEILGNGVYFATSQNNTRFWVREMQNLINNDVQIKGYALSGETVKTFTREQLKDVDFRVIGKVIKNVSFRL